MNFTKIERKENTGILSTFNNIIIESHFMRGTDKCYIEAINCLNEKLWVINVDNNEIGTYLQGANKFSYFQNGETTIYDINTGNILQKDDKYYFFMSDSFSIYIDLSNENVLVYHSKDKQLKFEYLFSPTYLSNDSLIYTNGNQIITIDFKSEKQKILEIMDLSGTNLAKINNPIIIYKSKFFVYLNGSYEDNLHKTFCIDIETGEIIKEVENFRGYMQFYGNTIYTINGNFLQILNADTIECSSWNFHQIAIENNFFAADSSRWLINKDYLYFVQNIGDTKAKVGILDLVNRTFVSKIELSETDGAISSIKVHNDMLFIHTQDGALHIFKEN